MSNSLASNFSGSPAPTPPISQCPDINGIFQNIDTTQRKPLLDSDSGKPIKCEDLNDIYSGRDNDEQRLDLCNNGYGQYTTDSKTQPIVKYPCISKKTHARPPNASNYCASYSEILNQKSCKCPELTGADKPNVLPDPCSKYTTTPSECESRFSIEYDQKGNPVNKKPQIYYKCKLHAVRGSEYCELDKENPC